MYVPGFPLMIIFLIKIHLAKVSKRIHKLTEKSKTKKGNNDSDALFWLDISTANKKLTPVP